MNENDSRAAFLELRYGGEITVRAGEREFRIESQLLLGVPGYRVRPSRRTYYLHDFRRLTDTTLEGWLSQLELVTVGRRKPE